jgi:hypothetical protein
LYLYRIAFLFSFLFSFFFVQSQSKIHGNVFDENGEAVAFANVLTLNPVDSSLVKGMVTDVEGKYAFENITPGTYLLNITMLGYAPVYTPVEIDSENDDVDMGTTTLGENSEHLSEVEIVARKPLYEQKIDRMVVNVENSITSAGASALDVLERSPGIIVNKQNYTLSMGGKQGVVVMINNKIVRMSKQAVVQMLEGMNSSNIEKIELITAPPASFEAQGDAGIIHIILKKNTDVGVNGNYALTAGYGRGEKAGASINFNYRKNKFNLYGDYSFLHNRTDQLFSFDRTIDYNDTITNTVNNSNRDPIIQNHNARLGIDYSFNEKTVLGVLITGYDNKWEMDAVNDVIITKNGKISDKLIIETYEINHWKNLGGNFNLKHSFEAEHFLNFDIDYLYYRDNNPTDYTNKFYSPQDSLLYEEKVNSEKITPINIWVGKTDYVKRINELFKVEVGLKATFSRFTNDVALSNLTQNGWEPVPELTQKYELLEDIAMAYTSLSFDFKNDFNLIAGLRYEYTNSNLSTAEDKDIVDRQYGNFFPNLILSKEINKDNRIQFAYFRRITRPAYTQLAPFRIFFDPSTFVAGNPALQPAITDAVKLEYKFKTYFLSLQYSYDDNAIARFVPIIDPETNESFVTSQNLDYKNTLALTLTLPVYIGNWWEMQNNIIASWQELKYDYTGTPLLLSQKAITINTTQTFNLPKNFAIEFSGFYNSPQFGWGITKNEAFWKLNIGIQKKFKKNNTTLRLTVDDVFKTGNRNSFISIPEQGIESKAYFEFSQTVVKLTFSQRFGNNKLKSKRDRKTGSEEERRRVN